MKNAIIFLCLILVFTSCKTKKAATGGTVEQAPVSNTAIEKLLTDRWVIEDITLPADMGKPEKKNDNDTTQAYNADHDAKEKKAAEEDKKAGNTIPDAMQAIKEKAYIVFNADHSFVFAGPGDDAGDKGTWKLTPEGDIVGTNSKGKETVFKSTDLNKGKFDVSVYPNEEQEGEGKGMAIILHFKRAARK